jgi:hypothetical protein
VVVLAHHGQATHHDIDTWRLGCVEPLVVEVSLVDGYRRTGCDWYGKF